MTPGKATKPVAPDLTRCKFVGCPHFATDEPTGGHYFCGIHAAVYDQVKSTPGAASLLKPAAKRDTKSRRTKRPKRKNT